MQKNSGLPKYPIALRKWQAWFALLGMCIRCVFCLEASKSKASGPDSQTGLLHCADRDTKRK